MKCLIVEDDFICRKVLQAYLSDFADVFMACSGAEAISAFAEAMDDGKPYDLICLDIMMPGMDGHEVLTRIRSVESERGIGGLDGVKIIMTTALDDSDNILGAFRTGCEAYVVKPIEKTKLINEICKLGLMIETKAGSR